MTLQLEVGKFYRNRKGQKRGPLLNDGDFNSCQQFNDGKNWWSDNGNHLTVNKEDDNDLIEEWKDEAPWPIRIIDKKSATLEEDKVISDIPTKAMIDERYQPSINDVLNARQNTHGDFTDNARITQTLKDAVMMEAGWQKLSLVQREALDMILHKVGRIVSGNPNEPDHWLDIAGYATLAKDRVSS